MASKRDKQANPDAEVDSMELPSRADLFQPSLARVARIGADDAPTAADEPGPADPLTLEKALRGVEESVDSELVRLLDELARHRDAEEELQSQLEEVYLRLGAIQVDLQAAAKRARQALDRRRSLEAERVERQATAIHRSLVQDGARLGERAAAWQAWYESSHAREALISDDPSINEQLAQYRKLDERLDTLELLPEAYREVVRGHHRELAEKLGPLLEEPRLPASDRLPVGLALAVECEDGRILARLLLPVGVEQVGEDLCARVISGATGALAGFAEHVGPGVPERCDVLELVGLQLGPLDAGLPLTAADAARLLRDAFADAQDPELRRAGAVPALVPVPPSALAALWRRAADDAAPGKGRKASD